MVLETVASLSLGGRELAFASSKSCQTKLPFLLLYLQVPCVMLLASGPVSACCGEHAQDP